MSKLTIAHFSRTGWQDANNGCDIAEFMPSDASILASSDLTELARTCVSVVLDTWTMGDVASVINLDDGVADGLDATEIFNAWRDAWRDTAVLILTPRLQERADYLKLGDE